MSLTDHLRQRESPVRSLIEYSFPLLAQAGGNSRAAKFVKKTIGIADVSKIEIVVPSRRREDSSVVGTAFDYWVRAVLQPLEVHSTVAANGAYTAEIFPGAGNLCETGFEILSDVEDFVARVGPHEGTMTSGDADLFGRYCTLLAWLEIVSRNPIGVLLNGSLGPLLATASEVGQLLDAVNPEIIRDLLDLARASDPVLSAWRGRLVQGSRYVPNPRFAGSSAVGGADADLLIGDQLIELKTSSALTSAEVRRTLLQLAGYTLLDFDDELSIRTLTVFYPRFGYVDSWPITSLIRPPGNNPLAWVQAGSEPGDKEMLVQLQALRAEMARLCDQLIQQTFRPAWVQEPAPLVALEIEPDDLDSENRRKLARHAATPPEVLEVLSSYSDFLVRVAVARHPSTPPSVLPALGADSDYRLRKLVAARPSTPGPLLNRLCEDREEEVRWTVAKNVGCPSEVLRRLVQDESGTVRALALETLDIQESREGGCRATDSSGEIPS